MRRGQRGGRRPPRVVVDRTVNDIVSFLAEKTNQCLTESNSVEEDIGEDAKALGISSVDMVKIRKLRARQKILFVVVGSFTAVASFIAGAITKELTASSYPYAIGSSASISGIAVISSEVDRRLRAFIVLLLAVASFVLGFLLTGGETETGAYPQGVVPEYGVYGS